MRPILFLAMLVLPSALPADDKKSDPKADAAGMKGKWRVVSTHFNGKEAPMTVDSQRILEFTEKEFTAYDGKKKGRTLSYSLDPAADPKRIDLVLAGTEQKSLGLYVLDGDDLKLCYGEPGAGRPVKLESKEGEKTFLIVLKRIKP
jgi:uncharacterized protein (TIGR03067 family)